ncbi:MAG: DUF1704 domain-containing protein [Myxococcales bacterium]|nr:DUF1704 domain-containing protein [Myxococcales bacterium]
MTSRVEALRAQSAALVDVARDVKVLSALSWPEEIVHDFLEAWRRGNPALPEPPPPRALPEDTGARLEAILDAVDPGDPVGQYLADTAESYRTILGLLSAAGTPEAHRISREVFGGPRARITGSTLTHLEAADRLLASTAALDEATRDFDEEIHLDADQVAAGLRARWEGFFEAPLEVVLDTQLAAKAAASADRVRLHAHGVFTPNDILQLSEHEIGVHSLTSRNGRAQPIVTALGLGAPRTTATQEGLATFAELVTGSIDLSRLRRLAYRVRAIHHAEEGASFLEVFEWLLSIGEPDHEAVRTTMRIFRGGDVRGRHVFTKDVVYLRGLFAVHTFLRKAIADHRPDLIRRLFAGRLTLGDCLELEEAFDDGTISPPKYIPSWAGNLRNLAAFLAFSTLSDKIDLSGVELEDVHAAPRQRLILS